jgi:hypothetical protein
VRFEVGRFKDGTREGEAMRQRRFNGESEGGGASVRFGFTHARTHERTAHGVAAPGEAVAAQS